MNIPKIRESPPPTNLPNSVKSNKARTNFPPTTRLPFPVETKNTEIFIKSNKATTNFTPTTRVASPIATELTKKQNESLTAFFAKKKNGEAPATNLIGFPQKFNAGLNEIIINKKKNNNKPPISTNLLGFPKNKTRKNRTNKSRKNRKNRKNRTRRS